MYVNQNQPGQPAAAAAADPDVFQRPLFPTTPGDGSHPIDTRVLHDRLVRHEEYPGVETRPQVQRHEDDSDGEYVVRVFSEFMDLKAERDGGWHEGPHVQHLHEMMASAISKEAIVHNYRDNKLLGSAIELLTIPLSHEFRDEDKETSMDEVV